MQLTWFRLSAVVFILLLVAAWLSLSIGAFSLSQQQIWQALLSDVNDKPAFIVEQMRLPRVVLGLLVGAGLAAAGTILQAVCRNPLASPGLIGTSSGAAFCIILAQSVWMLPASAGLPFGILGGLLAASISLALAWQARLSPLYLTLAGLSVSLFFSAAIIVLMIVSKTDANAIFYWLTGSLQNRTWFHVELVWITMTAVLALSWLFSSKLDLMLFDSASAMALGLSQLQWRLVMTLLAILLTALCVSVAGPVSFIGLIAPHIVRLSLDKRCGGRHKYLLPLSALTGAMLVVVADVIAKYLNIPVGILAVLFGGPVLLYLIQVQIKGTAA